MSHTGFRLVTTSMTLNGVIALILRFFPPNSIALQADYVIVVEDRPSVRKYCLPVSVFHFWPKLTHPAARSLCDSWACCMGLRDTSFCTRNVTDQSNEKIWHALLYWMSWVTCHKSAICQTETTSQLLITPCVTEAVRCVYLSHLCTVELFNGLSGLSSLVLSILEYSTDAASVY